MAWASHEWHNSILRSLRANSRALSCPSALSSSLSNSCSNLRTDFEDRSLFWSADCAASWTNISIIVATCSLHTNLNSSKAMAWSIVGASLFAVIIDARLRIFVIAVPMRPRASHQRPKDHDNRNTIARRLNAEPIIEVAVPMAGISGQPTATTSEFCVPMGKWRFFA